MDKNSIRNNAEQVLAEITLNYNSTSIDYSSNVLV